MPPNIIQNDITTNVVNTAIDNHYFYYRINEPEHFISKTYIK